MKKLIYIAVTIFISIFVLSCEEEEEAVNIEGTWSGVSFGIDISITYNGVEITCSSDMMQLSEEACESLPCDWNEDSQSCGPEALELFADNGGEVTLVLNSDGTATWTEFWEESYYDDYDGGDYTYTDECASTGTWTASGGNINFTSTTGEDMDDCNVFEAISESPIPYTTSGSDMSWTLPLEAVYGDDYDSGDYDYGDNPFEGSSMTINWSK